MTLGLALLRRTCLSYIHKAKKSPTPALLQNRRLIHTGGESIGAQRESLLNYNLLELQEITLRLTRLDTVNFHIDLELDLT